jgi:hypothetical protein
MRPLREPAAQVVYQRQVTPGELGLDRRKSIPNSGLPDRFAPLEPGITSGCHVQAADPKPLIVAHMQHRAASALDSWSRPTSPGNPSSIAPAAHTGVDGLHSRPGAV